MKRTLSILFTICSILHAQLAEKLSPQEAVIDEMFAQRDPAAFAQAVTLAKNLQIPAQIITEAQFLFAIDSGDQREIIRFSKKFSAQKEKFDANQSIIFTSNNEWKSAIQYGLALEALNNKDDANFKKHITEAFWLAPDRAASFSHHVRNFHTQQALHGITISTDIALPPLSKQRHGTMKLSEIAAKHRAVVLHFWSPWSHQFGSSIPLIESLAEQCSNNGVRFASIVSSDTDAATLDAAGKLASEIKGNEKDLWFRDNTSKPLTKSLRISEFPSIVIISPKGRILAHHPLSDPFLWKKLKTISPKFTAPTH